MWTLQLAIGWPGAAETTAPWWAPPAAATAWRGRDSQRQLAEQHAALVGLVYSFGGKL